MASRLGQVDGKSRGAAKQIGSRVNGKLGKAVKSESRWSVTGPGDFLHVPACLVHREINRPKDTSFRWVVIRSSSELIVVNLLDGIWEYTRCRISN